MHTSYVAVSLVMLVAAALPATALELPTDAPARERYVVGFHEMPALREGDSYHGERVVGATPELRFAVVEAATPEAFRARVMLDGNVRYVESDESDHKLLYTTNDYFSNHAANWGNKKIGAYVAWDRTIGTTAVKNAHLDSGLNTGHEEWAGNPRVVQGKNFYSTKSSFADERGCQFHGTHTAGTAAAPINNGKGFPGLAQMNVAPVKIFGGGFCMAASTSNLANAIKYAGDIGAHLSSNSWGGGSYSSAIHDAITYSVNKGVLFIAAAGNDGCTNCIGNPWKTQAANVLIVGATDQNDARASFSNTGPEVDISAPGVYIGSSTSGTADYHVMDGTSMAAPHVTGVAGLIKTLNPTFTASQIAARLTGTAVDLGAAGKDDGFGYGRLDAAAAVY